MRRLRLRNRSAAIAEVRRRLLQRSFPRLQMGLIVALTGAFGLLSSFTLLQLGLGSMTLRYPAALGLAYLFFLFLIWLWLRTNARDYLDVPDVFSEVDVSSGTSSSDVSVDLPDLKSGGGGDFGGGGAGGSFDMPASALDDSAGTPLKAVGEAVGSVGDADELAIPLIAIALAVGLALASLYVVYIAPVLLAEVLVDGALSYALLRHLRGQEPQHWLSSTVRRTALPFVCTAVFVGVVGAGLSAYAPGAQSVGQVFRMR